ncbi:subtilisin-like protease SBT1.6 [Syzygium oleosum]|uniref:subtilisin-like protease SBT1.6 n=1 Tax=Syzygium oleosum TaxID=219896 RepID=UPI0011D2C440|nr:subtilisin-like protease SBT1.6 [Syzygium oleosum]
MASSLFFFALSFFFFSFFYSVRCSSDEAAAAATYIVRVDSSSKPSIFPTHYHWYSSEFADPARILHTYDTVFHGFSATLTGPQASALLRHPNVLAAFEDHRRRLHTTRSPQFLGLRNQRGLWSESDYGSDIIVGVFDTGITPERRSFSDRNLGPVPKRWKGVCEAGVGFSSRSCNRKIVGARFFAKGSEAAGRSAGPAIGINETVEFRSPRDADGHGTHTASTAAGRYTFQASMAGYAPGIAKGVAPKARIASYKVCWKDSGCFDSDILAAFDAAVKDGVDVISISIGGGDGVSPPYYLDPIAIGSYGAVAHGVFVSASAGNDGPNGMSVTNLAPWLTSVGAGTIDRNFPADVTLGNRVKLSGVSLYSGPPLGGKMYPLVYPGKSGVLSASLCMENSLDPNLVKGKIVICDRGSTARVAKGLVVQKAGGVGMILANGMSNGEGLVGDAHVIPTAALGATEGDAVKSYISSTANPIATIDFRGTLIGIKPAPVVASFSGRGPNGLNPEILKPDLIAPGVNILAAWTDAVGPTGLASDKRKTEFNILSGTSMACPHVSGAAALLKSAHPDWSPAVIRSAMMTTANLVDNRNQLISDESTGKPASPYDFGAGHLHLDLAMDPGLVYDITNDDYVSFLCSIGYSNKVIQVITRSPANCPAKKPLPENLNYPSISALFLTSSTGVQSKTFIRTVTNVGQPNAVYRVRVESVPKGVTISVKPAKLVFTEAVKKQSYVVTVSADTRNLELGNSGAAFGSLAWSDGKHVVRSPIAVTEITMM